MVLTTATWAARAAAAILTDVYVRLPVETRTVFLTFDDGPSRHTSDLLEVLGEAKSSATFFLQGDRIERYPEAVRQISEAGHGTGSHSFEHLDGWRHRWTDIERDLDRGYQALAGLTGDAPQWMRPPFGRFRPGTIKWCRRNACRLALWDVMATDFIANLAPSKAAAQAARRVRPGSIVVLHDADAHHPRALETTRHVVSSLAESGWMMEKLPQPGSEST